MGTEKDHASIRGLEMLFGGYSKDIGEDLLPYADRRAIEASRFAPDSDDNEWIKRIVYNPVTGKEEWEVNPAYFSLVNVLQSYASKLEKG